jgi:nucleotide-binding universal stress UspA family protein
MLVVGCRSLPASQRVMEGSISRAVATWSPVPVVVVPEAWIQPDLATSPVVVGVRAVEGTALDRAAESDHQVLDFAFARAAEAHASLIVVAAFEPAWLQAWSSADMGHEHADRQSILDRRPAPWRDAHPDVEVIVSTVAEPTDHAILEASSLAQLTVIVSTVAEGTDHAILEAPSLAQLTVIGRHATPAMTGMLGGTARRVLHHTSRPLAAVPHGSPDQLRRELGLRKARGERPWSPIL